jgi:hypothetical protein
MYELVAYWPVKKNFTQPSAKKCRKDVMQATCAVVHDPAEPIPYPAKATARPKLTRIFGYFMAAVAKLRRHMDHEPINILAWSAVVRTGSTSRRRGNI